MVSGKPLEHGYVCTWGHSTAGGSVYECTCPCVTGFARRVGTATDLCVLCSVRAPVCVWSEGEPVNVSMCDCLLVRADVVVLVNTQL